ncbi:MAG: hypothetical protein QG625_3413 [Cyanobacteriota bacterium erpe_2018_sw_39hr_WHONDRS-SW48-000098_B_bin.30]|jgi:hypothetical protein|nr:hypothetical protein [Cyanobacteriota bacterium erpe_2018_sw_39hr_WHONDRS-SW48-000098_B_bin.30]
MEKAYGDFSVSETMQHVSAAAYGVFCHIIFDGAVHGLVVALILLVTGALLAARKHRLAAPFLIVGKKLLIFCLIVASPGLYTFLTTHALPPVGNYNINSIGYFSLWSLICAHGLGEEINYQWTVKPAAEQTENAADSESLAEEKQQVAVVEEQTTSS